MSALLGALINGAIVSTLVTAAVWLAMHAASRRLNAATKYLVWWTLLAMTVFLPLWYLPEGLIPRTPADHVHQVMQQQVMRVPIVPHEIQGAESWAPHVIAADPGVEVRSPFFPFKITASVPKWVGAAWTVTSFLMLLRLAISWRVLQRRRARATEALPSLSARLDHWRRQCGSSRRTLRIGVSAEVAIPMVAGLRRPSILIPAGLLDALNETELDQIGIHEAAHVTRGDDWALATQRIIEALFPLHPVVRWVGRRIDLEREIACDDFVLRASGRAHPYAACLLRVAELTSGVRGSVVAAAVADEGSDLTRRVDMLLDKSRHTGTRPLKVPVAAVVAAILGVTRIVAHTPGPIAFALPKASALAVSAALPVHAETLGPAATPAPPAASVVPPAGPSSPLPGAAKPATSAPPVPAESPASQPATADVITIPDVPPTGPSSPPPSAANPVVTIPVVVREPRNRVVTGLDKANFRLFEDGVEQELAQVRAGDIPFSLALLIDTSDTMAANHVDGAYEQLRKRSNSEDEFFVEEFNHQSGPGTAIFDAVNRALGQIRQAHNSRKAMLVITDAGSGDSKGSTFAQLLEEQKLISEFVQEGVLVYAMDIVDNGDNSPPRLLAQLTEQTGGHLLTLPSPAVPASGAEAVATAAAGVGLELRTLYELKYTPRNTAHKGDYRTVQIEVIVPPGLPPLKPNYRPGYYESRL
jgi:beta-lactamase regulating signal transducer with metallopeptidase domain